MCEPLRSFVVAASVHCQPFFCHCIVQWLGMADYMHPCITTLCDRYKHPCFACGGDFELGGEEQGVV